MPKIINCETKHKTKKNMANPTIFMKTRKMKGLIE